MTKKVLCAVDDTELSKSAVALATEPAKATGAELTLLVVNVPVGGAGRGELWPTYGGARFEARARRRSGYR